MKRVVLISCVSKKLNKKSKASDLYISTLFRLNWAYANNLRPDAIFILSAKHGLVLPHKKIEPYDVTLNNMSSREIKDWADRVLCQLVKHANLKRDHFIFLAGNNYRKYLIPDMTSYEVPMEGLPIGKQLQYLSKACAEKIIVKGDR